MQIAHPKQNRSRQTPGGESALETKQPTHTQAPSTENKNEKLIHTLFTRDFNFSLRVALSQISLRLVNTPWIEGVSFMALFIATFQINLSGYNSHKSS